MGENVNFKLKTKYTGPEIRIIQMGLEALKEEFKDAVPPLTEKDFNDLAAGFCKDEQKLYWARKAFRAGERVSKQQAKKLEAYFKSTPSVRLVHQIVGEKFRNFHKEDYGNLVVLVAGIVRILMEKELITQEEIDKMNATMQEEANVKHDDLKERAEKSGIILP